MTLVPPEAIAVPHGDAAKWSNPLDVAELSRHVESCRDLTATPQVRGARLESLLVWLLPHVDGVSAQRKNSFSDDGAQEVDVVFFNEGRDPVFRALGEAILGECKNWAKPVDSGEVAWMDWKMRLGGVKDGVLLAANGITARNDRLQDASAIIKAANSDNPQRRIYVVTLNEVAALTSTDGIREMFRGKLMSLATRDPLG
jgi:hypothetical protein